MTLTSTLRPASARCATGCCASALRTPRQSRLSPTSVTGANECTIRRMVACLSLRSKFFTCKTPVCLFARLASAAALLQPAWGAQATVVNADIRGWLAAQPDRSAGVVVAAGVLHCFVDPVAVVLELARVADHAVVIEANHPVGLLAAHN